MIYLSKDDRDDCQHFPFIDTELIIVKEAIKGLSLLP